MSNALLLIDMQYDFCSPDGALYVPGADRDCIRVSELISQNMSKIDNIFFSLDWHEINSIFHPIWFVDENGDHPDDFTVIKYKDFVEGKWRVSNYEEHEHTDKYLQNLENIGKSHIIWPPHCIHLSKGSSVEYNLMAAIMRWEMLKRRQGIPILKGTNRRTEQYGIFKTQFNKDYDVCEDGQYKRCNFSLSYYNDIFIKYDNVYIAGEALSHCVGETMRQIIVYKERFPIKSKLYLIEDCTSNVAGFKDQGEAYKNMAANAGIELIKSNDIKFQ